MWLFGILVVVCRMMYVVLCDAQMEMQEVFYRVMQTSKVLDGTNNWMEVGSGERLGVGGYSRV